MTLQYPAAFVDECKRVYPDWLELRLALEAGSEMVGRYLDDSVVNGVPFQTVIAATSLADLQVLAHALQDRKFVYGWWTDIYKRQRG